MSKRASKFQEAFMSRLYHGKEIFKPLNTGWIDEHVACVREYVANVFFYRKGNTTIMIDAGYNYERLAEKMAWLDIDPATIEHILITHQDTDHVGAVERDADGLFAHSDTAVSSTHRQKPPDPNAPFDGYDESDDTEAGARGGLLPKQNTSLGAAIAQQHAALRNGARPTLAYRAVEDLTRKLDIQGPYKQGMERAVSHVMNGNRTKSTPPAGMMRRFDVEQREIASSPVCIFRSKATAPDRRVLFLHGGGGMMRATPFHYTFVKRLVMQTRAEVWMSFYPLAPGANFFDSLDACFAAYQEMLQAPDQLPIAFAGDSAGANLELAVCRRALDAGLFAPGGIVCISPATGLEDPDCHAKFQAQEIATRDPMLCVEMIEGIREYWYKDVPLDDNLGNPAFMDYTSFPPVLLFLGTAEIFYPATLAIPERMQEAGVELTQVMGEGLMHDWALLNYFPEGAAAQGQIKRFICAH